MSKTFSLTDSDALLVIDVQNDFCSGGALAVPEGEAVVPLINGLLRKFPHSLATQDWHPRQHKSFASQHPGKDAFGLTEMPYGPQVLWPDHCIQGQKGSAFHPDLETNSLELVLRKGFRAEIDSYSAFFENDRTTSTGLTGYLQQRKIKRVFLCGLATDFCVYYSAIDALREGFEVYVIEDACRAIDLEGSLDKALKHMRESGVSLITSTSF
ncbi:bifunctional nicotinamidase/pyrazinamidase [Kiloniella laminariae]|uniref:nicotinamidase n=1 Tax=Kiloniella laminariae TaxID=454162 RepID=A0ABT4LIR8_9PROT|nr:bifunctional nicotinamidase/pyrazinamidase [Kiloniella laminariae]MCZ4280999.1 bifunctional nicotinamidase/pyrazinamidase [Kiloniella laminariae]